MAQLGANHLRSNGAGFNDVVSFQNSGGTENGTLCRAWVNFNGNSSGIRASFNTSSITRNSTGNYSVNFSTALSDANFAAVGSASESSSDSQRYLGFFDSFSTTSCRLETRYPGNGQLEDVAIVSVVVLR